jgi:hypothetical protein
MPHDHVVPSTDRASMLLSCPANAPSREPGLEMPDGMTREVAWRRHYRLQHDETYVRDLHDRHDGGAGEWSETWGFLMTADEEMSVWQRQAQINEAAAVAQNYLDRLPSDQAGHLRINAAYDGVVVQVTRDSDQVRAEFQEQIGDVAIVEMETVRFSYAELEGITARIAGIQELRWYSIGPTCESRVDVTVPGDPDEARRLIEQVADPCSFAVTIGGQPVPASALSTRPRSHDQE